MGKKGLEANLTLTNMTLGSRQGQINGFKEDIVARKEKWNAIDSQRKNLSAQMEREVENHNKVEKVLEETMVQLKKMEGSIAAGKIPSHVNKTDAEKRDINRNNTIPQTNRTVTPTNSTTPAKRPSNATEDLPTK